MEIGQKLKEARAERGLTQVQLAKLSDVSEKSIRRYELSEANVTISIVEKLSKALDIDINYFLSPNMSPNRYFVPQYVPQSPKFVPKSNNEDLSKEEQKLLELYRKMDKEERDIVLLEWEAKARRIEYDKARHETNERLKDYKTPPRKMG